MRRSPLQGQARSLRLGRSQGSSCRGCVSACRRGGWEERRREGAPPPPPDTHAQIDRVKDRFGRRHSETDRCAHTQTHRHPQTKETATQRQAGDPRTAVRHTQSRQQTAREQRPRERKAATLSALSPAARICGSLQEDRNGRVCMWGGGGSEAGGRGCCPAGTHRRSHTYRSFLSTRGPSLALAPRDTSETLGSGGG